MSKLTELLDKLCPDGVECKPMGEVGSFLRGGGPQKKDFLDEGLPCIHYGQIYTRYGLSATSTITRVSETVFDRSRKAQPGNVIIAVTSENDEDLGDALAWLGSEAVAVSNHTLIFDSDLNPMFISYFLRSEGFESQKRRVTTGTKVRSLSEKGMSSILIPVPPLGVQQEIVRVLDAFTDLEQSLVSELELRKKQYEEYRQETFQQVAINSPKIQLKNAGIWFGGGTPSKKEPRFWEKGNIPWISPKDMGTHVIRETQDYITQAAIEGSSTKLVPENSVALVVRSSILEHTLPIAFVPVSSALNQDMRALIPGGDILPRFFYHALCASREHLLMTARRRGGSVASLDSKKLREYEISVPSLKLQQEIVAKLDTFETLIQSIEQEISLRRQQYEFYRDELLIFPPRKTNPHDCP